MATFAAVAALLAALLVLAEFSQPSPSHRNILISYETILIGSAVGLAALARKLLAPWHTAKTRRPRMPTTYPTDGITFRREVLLPAIFVLLTIPLALLGAAAFVVLVTIVIASFAEGGVRPGVAGGCALLLPMVAMGLFTLYGSRRIIRMWGSPLAIIRDKDIVLPHNKPASLNWSDIRKVSAYRLGKACFLDLELIAPEKFFDMRRRRWRWIARNSVTLNIPSTRDPIYYAALEAHAKAMRQPGIG